MNVTPGGVLDPVIEAAAAASYTYDRRARLVRVQHPGGALTTYSYSGDRLTGVDDRGVVCRYRFDAEDRLLRSECGAAEPSEFSYEPGAVEARQGRVATRQEYDAAGRVVLLRQTIGGIALEARVRYDADGRIAETDLPGLDNPVYYSWRRDRLVEIRQGSRRLVRLSATGLVERLRFGNGLVSEVQREPEQGRPRRFSVAVGDTVRLEHRYRYDGSGRLIDDGSRRYRYDHADRLQAVVASSDASSYAYSYDSRGNLVAVAGESRRTLRVDRLDRLVGVELGVEPAGTVENDRFGRPVRVRASNRASARFGYDDRGRLRWLERAGQPPVRLTYDHLDRLVLVEAGDRTERSFYGPDGALLAVTDEAGRPIRVAVHRPDARPPGSLVAWLRGPRATPEYVHTDPAGTCQLVSGAGAEDVAAYRYEPYGAPVVTGRSDAPPPCFRGLRWSAALGMYEAGPRWYQPEWGRFLTPDGHTGQPDDARLVGPHVAGSRQPAARDVLRAAAARRPLLLNRYAFCLDDPVNRLDPDGRWSFGGLLLTLVGTLWTLPNTVIGLLIEVTCLIGEVLRWLVSLLSAGSTDWQPVGFDTASSPRLDAVALVFSGGWLGSFPTLSGITFGNVVFVYGQWAANPCLDLPGEVHPPAYSGSVAIPRRQSLYEHELRHTNQYGWLGPLFLLAYLGDVALHGYRDSWLERDASDHGGDVCEVPGQANPTSAPSPVSTPVPPAPVGPPSTAVGITAGVGPAGPNQAADVRTVQQRLVDLRYLSGADRDHETPPDGSGTVDASTLPATIAAVRAVQADVLADTAPTGQLAPRDRTVAALNRAIPRPIDDDYTRVAAARLTIVESVTKAAALSAPVGDVPDAAVTAGSANRPADVTVVQQRLVDLGYLAADHSETPTGTGSVRAQRLPATRAALRRFQLTDSAGHGGEVQFWKRAGEVAGTITPEVAAVGDATSTLLARIGSYREQFPDGSSVAVRDHVVSQFTVSADGVSYRGIAKPEDIPDADYAALGLTPAQTRAMRAVSSAEGRFDAVNTYDRAVVSFGFLQFAGGGRSLEQLVALHKARRGEAFGRQFQTYGIDVEFDVSGGSVANAALVVLDPANRRVLRGASAEAAIRSDKKLTGLLVAAGRDAQMKSTQLELATARYLLASLRAQATFDADVIDLLDGNGLVSASHAGADARAFRAGAAYPGLRAAGKLHERRAHSTASVESLLRSEQGVAVLLDRAVQEGEGPAGAGVQRLIGSLQWVADQQGLFAIAEVAAREDLVLQQVVNGLKAEADVGTALAPVIAAVNALAAAAKVPDASVSAVTAQPEVATARAGIDATLPLLPGLSFGTRRATLEARLPELRTSLTFSPPPATVAALRTQLSGIATTLGRLTPNARVAQSLRSRVAALLSGPLAGPVPQPVPGP